MRLSSKEREKPGFLFVLENVFGRYLRVAKAPIFKVTVKEAGILPFPFFRPFSSRNDPPQPPLQRDSASARKPQCVACASPPPHVDKENRDIPPPLPHKREGDSLHPSRPACGHPTRAAAKESCIPRVGRTPRLPSFSRLPPPALGTRQPPSPQEAGRKPSPAFPWKPRTVAGQHPPPDSAFQARQPAGRFRLRRVSAMGVCASLAQRSVGFNPVCLATRASIRGPISSPSWKANTKSGNPSRFRMRWEPVRRASSHPILSSARRTFRALHAGQ